MGRKKKGPIKSQHELEQEAIEELRVDLLALCAVDPPPDESRTEFNEALLALRQAQEEDYAAIEESANRLRLARTDFLNYLDLERHEIFEIYRDLQAKHDALSVQDLLAFECVYRSYLKQVATEENLMDQVLEFLNKLYTAPKDNRQLGVWIRQLSKRQLMTSSSRVSALKLQDAPTEVCELPKDIPIVDSMLIDRLPSSHKSLILEAKTVVSAAKAFFESPPQSKSLASLLVVGPPGSGKTHLCSQVEAMAKSCKEVQVFRSKIPVDFMGASVGDVEYSMGSLFEAVSASGKCVLILDDLDLLLGTEESLATSTELRLKVSFLSCLDHLRTECNALLIFTASTSLDDDLARFHKTFLLQAPDREQRVAMSRYCLGIKNLTEGNERALDTLTTCMLGRSRAEVTQYCRQAIRKQLVSGVDIGSPAGKQEALEFMISELSELAPESLRTGVTDGFVDMTVVSSAELLQGISMTELQSLPLLGEGMNDAWRQLEALIVTPLCQSEALDEILSGSHRDSQRIFCGGALLTGAAATGKTTLAYHAARVASKYLPSVKLLDVSCTSLVHKEVGGSERAMRRLFAAVRAAAPCILLMDGIENIAGVRGKDNTTHGTMDRILSTLLTELDGVDNSASSTGNKEASAKFAMIGITHEASWIDAALRRPGRLEKTIDLRKPDRQARQVIAMRQLNGLVFEDDLTNIEDLSVLLAEHTAGESAAEIAALCEEARMASVKEAIQKVGSHHDSTIVPELRMDHFSSLVVAHESDDDVSV